MSTSQAAVYINSTHTAVVVGKTATHVLYIPLASLKVEKVSLKEFSADWVAYPEYPVRRAAQVYLQAGGYRPIAPQAREHLEAIVADPATEYPTFDVLQSTMQGIKMAKSPATRSAASGKEAVKGKPVARASDHAALDKIVVQARTAGPKGKPVVTPIDALKAGKPAPKGKAVAEPAVKAAAKSAPVAAKGKPVAAADAAKPTRNRIPDDVKYVVVDTARVKRGFLQEFVTAAQGMKVFTREKLEANFAERGGDTRTYFPYCVGKGIFGQAPAKA